MEFSPYFSSELLKRMMPKIPEDKLEEYHKYLHEGMLRINVNTVNRMACLLAQLSLESGDLRWWKEWDSGSDNYQEYDFRYDLGNNAKGMGAKYCGRGPIQTTGFNNYKRASQAAYEAGIVDSPDTYINHPELLEQPEHGFFASLLFWDDHDLNDYADNLAFDKISYIINAGPWKPGYDESPKQRQVALGKMHACKERRDRFFWIVEILNKANE